MIGDKTVSPSDKLAMRAVKLALRHDTSGLLFFDLWRELGQAVRSLVICNYESVPRSLRWMIEASVFWADMQLDDLSAHEQFKWYYDQRDRIDANEYRRLFEQIYSISSARFEERLFLKDKYRRPRLGEVLNNLKFSVVGPVSDLDPATIKKSLKTLYSEYSEYSHVTLRTVRELYYECLHGDFAFYQDYAFDPQTCDESMRNLWRTIDNLLALIIMTEAEFLGYSTPQAFVRSLQPHKGRRSPLMDVKVVSRYLPSLNTLIFGNRASQHA